jgi:hypothetical protein
VAFKRKPIELTQEPIWEIQFDETIVQYRAFCLYRDLGPNRSLSKVSAVWTKHDDPDLGRKQPSARIREWSSVNRWVERADSYWIDFERRLLEQRETEISRLQRMELQFGRGLIAGAIRRLFGFNDEANPTQNVEAIDWNQVTPGELAILGRLGIETARLATNRPTALVKAALMITSTEFIEATRDLTELAMRHIPDERKPLFAEEVRAWSDGERGMLTS